MKENKIIRCVSNAFGNLPSRVLPENSRQKFELTIQNSFFAENITSVKVKYIRDDWRMADGRVAYLSPDLEHLWQNVEFSVSDGILSFVLELQGEFEHWIGIFAENNEIQCHEDFYFYTLKSDLLQYQAFKGNVHSHSTESDGFFPPEYVPAYMRRAGFDFTAVTDHKKYAPSLQAIKAMKSFDSGLEVFKGEEVESFGVGINHILSLGASGSISDWEYSPDSDFFKRVENCKKELGNFPEHECNYTAQFEAVTSKIHEWGGLSVFCHPYWKQNSRYASTPLLSDIIMRRGNFDALEVGNYNVARTALANAKIMDLIRDCDFHKPLIGSSDWHGRPSQKDNIDYTVIFAKAPAFDDFAEAVRAERCVGVGGYADEFPFGSFRLVKYTLFLMQHYFMKLHDPLCAEQGNLLLRALDGDTTVLLGIVSLKIKIELQRKAFFGVSDH